MALALVLDLQNSYPTRDFQLVFHTSGITRRILEIQYFLSDIKFIEIDDFSSIKLDSKKPSLVKNFMKTFLNATRIVATDPGTKSIPRIYLWTRSIRGHYSYRPIKAETVLFIIDRMRNSFAHPKTASIFVHYRLGDLMNLDSKTFIPPETINTLIDEALKKIGGIPSILIATENPQEAKKMIVSPANSLLEFETYDPFQTIFLGLESKIFIGTNSKLSLWIALMRSYLSNSAYTYLPTGLARNLKLLSPGRILPLLTSYEEKKYE